ncbi:MAG TPA: hypothetical protein VF041_01030, partial [Gemmatimonadaceae bacterium]
MRRAAVWVEAGSTRDHLRFGYGQVRGSPGSIASLDEVRVSACGVSPRERRIGERVLWLAAGTAPARPASP